MSETKIWIVIKQWCDHTELAGAYLDEQEARYAASQLMGMESALINLWTTTLQGKLDKYAHLRLPPIGARTVRAA